MFRLHDLIPVGNTLGECPLWNERDGHLWWTDIHQSHLHRLNPATRAIATLDLPERLGSFAFLADDDTHILAAFESGLGFYDLRAGQVDWIVRPEHGTTGRRFNDGRVDRHGRFWISTMVEEPYRVPPDSAGLFCLMPDLRLAPVLTGIAIGNGLCTSPDGKTLYFTDSPSSLIHAYDLEPQTGAIGGRRLFAEAEAGEPDGATIDSEGCMWSARWGAGKLVRHAPDGRDIGQFALPVSQPTSVAFGGDDLKLLFVTSAQEGLGDEPLAGAILIYEVESHGLPEERFRPDK